eukprot:TRINITY_DN14331_c0_g1_i1.p1 TRINITY_DN14331_c0_g1~~TRINITY_DN14331_c0_g1_i1.p1  ORF type:complete len:311 (-),score=51.60 TRINITY_DN14331_c0_g1_i1:259-1191(-)
MNNDNEELDTIDDYYEGILSLFDEVEVVETIKLPKLMSNKFGSIDNNMMLQALGLLANDKEVEMLTKTKFRKADERFKEVEKILDLFDIQTRMVYDCLKNVGTEGASKYNIRRQTKSPNGMELTPQALNKILKNLENYNLIKCFKSIKYRRQNFYILSHLEPHPDHLPGNYYDLNTKKIKTEYIELVRNACLECVNYNGVNSIEEVHQFVINKGNRDFKSLTKNDIETMLEVLVYDDELQRVELDGLKYKPKLRVRLTVKNNIKIAKKFNLHPTGLSNIPCTSCPVFNKCSDTGDITPYNCQYLDKWLEF